MVMKCYYNNPSATHLTLDRNGWVHTGDLGTMDEEGYFKIEGRLKDMVIRGGENLYPREIEEFLHHHPKVRDVYVIGVPDEKYGEELMAWVALKEGEAATPEEIRELLRRQDRALQDPAVRQVRRRLPDVGLGQDPEVQDAPGVDRRTRARGRRRGSRRPSARRNTFPFYVVRGRSTRSATSLIERAANPYSSWRTRYSSRIRRRIRRFASWFTPKLWGCHQRW